MKFPWSKYIEIPTHRRNTLQIFITNKCNLKCNGCFARKVMSGKESHISIEEYEEVMIDFISKGGRQVNLLGGEPLLHPNLHQLLCMNSYFNITTTIYTNGYFLDNIDKYLKKDLQTTKLRVSIYSKNGKIKDLSHISSNNVDFEGNFMVSSKTTLNELLDVSHYLETVLLTKVFFISSLRELDNDREEFFDDTPLTMPILEYKELVHRFLDTYEGNMDIHVSNRGVFQSTLDCSHNKCKFSNYFIGGKIIQCPYDVVNLKYQDDYEFDKRHCQHNNTCLMTKVIYRKK